MRRGLAAAAAAALAVLGGCGGGRSVPSLPPVHCPPAPHLALAARPAARPDTRAAACLARRYSLVVGEVSWGDVPARMVASNPNVRVLQARSLLHAGACGGCDPGGLPLERVRREHPDWILRDASGAPVHLRGAPGAVLLDFGNPAYQVAWLTAVKASIRAGGWTGVYVADAGNDPRWSATPVDPRTGAAMRQPAMRRYLAQALALVRAGLKISGYSLVANNPPPATVVRAQIGSTDAVCAGAGFGGRTGASWLRLFRYFRAAERIEVGTLIWDTLPPDAGAQRVYALAGYLLVADRASAYGAPAEAMRPFDALDAGGFDEDPKRDGAAWTRAFPGMAVAVNPGDAPAAVELPDHGRVVLRPGSAAIATPSRLLEGRAA